MFLLDPPPWGSPAFKSSKSPRMTSIYIRNNSYHMQIQLAKVVLEQLSNNERYNDDDHDITVFTITDE